VAHDRERFPGALGHLGIVIVTGCSDVKECAISNGVGEKTIFGILEGTGEESKDTTETTEIMVAASEARQVGGARGGGEDEDKKMVRKRQG
jgi:hypothetical protein